LTLGFWLSQLTGSYVAGFGYTSLAIILLIALIFAFRKILFLNPIISVSIKRIANDDNA
jgi:hypothetical protein